MTALKKLLLAFTVMGVSAAAYADDNFTSPVFRPSSDKLKKPGTQGAHLNYPSIDGVVDKGSAWGVRLENRNSKDGYYATYDNVSGSYNGIKLHQENLLGNYDPFYPVGGSTRLYDGSKQGSLNVSASYAL
ncbi:hypothetical protein [Pseudomonas sp. NPDC089569]|uniref:hypothetical protein n=1 Tax=Pseudomonas sp. NPDC089569 TaxID=3390722 RepID=UPI003D03EABE